MTTLQRIAPQTYRFGEYVIFQQADGGWKAGRPVDPADIAAGFVADSVLFHRTLRECRQAVARRDARQERTTVVRALLSAFLSVQSAEAA